MIPDVRNLQSLLDVCKSDPTDLRHMAALLEIAGKSKYKYKYKFKV